MGINTSEYLTINGFLEEFNAYIKTNKELRKTFEDVNQTVEDVNQTVKDVNQTVKDVNQTVKDVVDMSRELHDAINEATKELSSQIRDIDWDETMRTWRESAEKFGERGWTFPLSMTPGEVVDFSEIEDIDTAMEEYFSHDNGYAYARMKRDVLDHKIVEGWKDLLEQCFNNYENESYLVAIPNLFIIVEGIARMLISGKFEKYKKAYRRPKVYTQFKVVREEVSTDRVYLVVYVSVLSFLNEVFKDGKFDENPTRFPIINRDWVLHGKDTPSNWKKVDALRLFNAIYSFTAVDFLLEEPKEQLTEA
ncbi:DUF948 domain-containing protein [Bacillus toyonensis]|uniref:DUF948 domain-containing protein n=1 Tax=Bacillus toyonensis TaxID=155322 RepID=UPI00254218F1|nr:DUF948 domain-containing protein [Bacillus toyonensis]WIG43107.1 DUF948 domain-containing protein [Bacillus toyonensis]